MAIVYHLDTSAANNDNIRDHLFSSLTLAESMYPKSAFIVCGDFSRLNVQPIMNRFRLKQIVKVPTSKNAILDLILTNLQAHYENPQAFPPFGLSDHNTVLSSPKVREKSRKTTKFVLRRDLRPSRKAELGRYLGSMDGHPFHWSSKLRRIAWHVSKSAFYKTRPSHACEKGEN